MINLEWIAGLAANPAVFSRAQAFYRTGPVRTCEASKEETGYLKFTGEVAEGNTLYHPEIILDEKKMTSDHSCDCGGFHNKFGACKHVIVTLLKAYEDEKKNRLVIKQEGQSDNVALRQMLKHYEEQWSVMDTQPEQVRVLPKLSVEGQRLKLELYIGITRMYLLKDLFQFADALNAKRLVSYGKELEFKHHLSAFEETSQPLIQLIMQAVEEARTYLSTDPEEPGLILNRHLTDAFFEIYSHTPIDDLPLYHENPNLRFTLQNSESGFVLSTEPQKFQTFHGQNLYVMDADGIYQCDQTFTEKYQPILELLALQQLVIAPEQLGEVLSIVYPIIGDRLQHELGGLNITPMTPKLYLDMPARSGLELELEFSYDPASPILLRDLAKEADIKKAILDIGFKSVSPKLFELKGDESMYEFLQTGAPKLQQIGETYISDKVQNMKIKDAGSFSIGVSMRNNWIHLDFEKLGFDPQEFEQVLAGYREQKKYVRLKDGSFLNLNDHSLKKMTSLLEDLNIESHDLEGSQMRLPGFRALYLEQFAKLNPTLGLKLEDSFEAVAQTFQQVDDSSFKVPASLSHILRPYQETGYKWLQTLHHFGFSGILADDMGLGKTLQVITMLKANDLALPALIITPSSLMFNWKMEIEKFAPSLKTLIVSGDPVLRQNLIESGSNYDIIITSYDLIRRDREHYAKQEYGYCIIDEAHYIKNHRTLNAKAVKTIRSNFRLALTGTPIENSLTDLWSIFDFILPGYLGSYQHFRKIYEVPIVKNQSQSMLERLYQLVSPFILRRLKKDVLKELPPKIDTALYTQMNGEQEKLYLATLYQMQQSFWESSQSGARVNRMQVLTQLMRLRQLCCHPSLYLQDYNGESAKYEMCMELLADCLENKRKVLLFSQFTSMLAIIAKGLDDMGVKYYKLTGSTKSQLRVEMAEAFNNDDTPIFLISLKAGGTGLNLTGADVVIHYDPWWNLSAENQATDRAHRIGQEKTVQVFKLLTKNTIEEKIQELQERKKELTESVIREGETFINQLNDDEIMSLFKND